MQMFSFPEIFKPKCDCSGTKRRHRKPFSPDSQTHSKQGIAIAYLAVLSNTGDGTVSTVFSATWFQRTFPQHHRGDIHKCCAGGNHCLHFPKVQQVLLLTVMPPVSPEALYLTKAKCLQALPLSQHASSPVPVRFRLKGVINGPDSELSYFISLTM